MAFKLEFNVDYLIAVQYDGKYYYNLSKYENGNLIPCLNTSYDNENNRTYPVNIYNLTDNEIVNFFDLFITKTFSYYWWFGNRQFINSELQRIFSDSDCYISYNINGIKVSQFTTHISYQTIQTFVNFDLYQEILDNTNLFQLLNGLLQTSSPQLSDDDYKLIRAVEAYNDNYFRARNINYIPSSDSGGGSNVDLSTINTQLTNISNKLSADVLVDDNPEPENVSITQSIVNLSEQLQEINERPVVINNENLDPWSNA